MWPFRVNTGFYMAKVNYMQSKKIKVKKHTVALYKIHTSIQKNSTTAQYNKQMM
jgi:hypothetical protein